LIIYGLAFFLKRPIICAPFFKDFYEQQMPKVSVIAKNYAKALFSAAKTSNSIDQIATELESFKKNFSLDFARELKNPVIAKADSAKIIGEISSGLKLGKLLSKFLIAVTRNKRLNLFPEIYEEFNRLLRLQKNILDVELITTSKLEKDHIENIKVTISKKHPGKTIEFTETIKKEILGGLQIKIGSNLIDASSRNQLSRVSNELIRAAK